MDLRATDPLVRDRAFHESGNFLAWNFLRDARPDLQGAVRDVDEALRRNPPTDEGDEHLVSMLWGLVLESIDRPEPGRVALLRAIGAAKPWISAPRFVDLLADHFDFLAEEEVHEIVHALDTSLHLIRADPRLAIVAAAFVRPRARIVLSEVAHSSHNRCTQHDARRILEVIANRVSDQIGHARLFTPDLRDSAEEPWPTTRSSLRERGFELEETAIGDWIPEQAGPFLIVVSRNGRAGILELAYVGGNEVEFLQWSDLDPLRSYPYSLDVHAALVMLNEESPVAVDPVDVLIEAVQHETNDLRQDREGTFFRWGGLRRFLAEHRIDPDRALLFDASEGWFEGTSRRVGVVLHEGRFLEFVTDVDYPSGVVGMGPPELSRVRMWQVDEIQARLQHGALIDAARRLEALERSS
jgi:hypothetical protein